MIWIAGKGCQKILRCNSHELGGYIFLVLFSLNDQVDIL